MEEEVEDKEKEAGKSQEIDQAMCPPRARTKRARITAAAEVTGMMKKITCRSRAARTNASSPRNSTFPPRRLNRPSLPPPTRGSKTLTSRWPGWRTREARRRRKEKAAGGEISKNGALSLIPKRDSPSARRWYPLTVPR